LTAALADGGERPAQALFVCTGADHDAAVAGQIAGAVGLPPAQARLVAGECGGGAAIHMAVQAIAAGVHDVVAVVGVADRPGHAAVFSPDEVAAGLTDAAWHALVMRRYMYEYSWRRDDFAGFAILAHHNALTCEHAAVHQAISADDYRQATILADPLTELDVAPPCSGAASLVLCATELARGLWRRPVRVTASDVARDTAALHDRADALWLRAAHDSARAAYGQAGRTPTEIAFFEAHDASTVLAALSLEAAGLARRGDGVRLAQDGALGRRGRTPMCTMGGLLGRGEAGGASGVYQVVEAVLQLRGAAGANQIDGAQVALVQSLGGNGACAATHILEV
jgi:acetyl-CoA C-acetyltransferase